MAKSNHNQFKAGLFIVGSFSVAAAIFFGITGSSLLSGPTHDYTALFDLHEDVSGLTLGSEVRIGGFKVGTVQKVDIVVDDKGLPHTLVTFRTPARYTLKQDAIVAIQASLTGAVNLNVASLGTGPAADSKYPLDGRPDALSSAIASVGNVGPEITDTLEAWRPRVTGILDDVRPRTNAAIDQVRTTAVTADETIKQLRSKIEPGYEKYAGVADATKGAMAGLDAILGDTKGDIRKTMANLADMTGALKTRVPTVMDKVADNLDAFRAQMTKIGTILDDTKAIAANTADFTGGARTVLNNNRARIDEIVKSASFAAANLAAASSEIRHAPWRLLYKPSDGEVANQNLYDAARQFAEASRKMQDSAEALKASAADPKADAASVQAMIDKLDIDFANYKKVEATLWDRVKK